MSNPLCNCDTPNTVGNGGGAYDYMHDLCVCQCGTVLLGMRDLNGVEVTTYPVIVYNVNADAIGLATTKSQYRIIWNTDPDNQEVGTLDNGPGPFMFSLTLKDCNEVPPYVIGDPQLTEVDEIYDIEYASQYE